MSEDEIRIGIEALTKVMGLTGAIRFIREFEQGRGDYTAEREKILGNPTVDEVFHRLEAARARRRRRASGPVRSKMKQRLVDA